MIQKKIAVAIPTYNRKEYLHECLESLELQTYKDFKVIIFDNGSNYDVSEFITSFPELEIGIEKNKENLGVAANFKKIINYNFESSYVIIFHDDDTINPLYFEKALDFLDTNPDVVLVGSNMNFVKSNQHHTMKNFDMHVPKNTFKKLNRGQFVNKIMSGFNLGFGTVIYRSSLLKKITVRSEEFDKWFDRPLVIDLIQENKAALTQFKFINYRVHEGQDSHKIETAKFKQVIHLLKYYRERSTARETRAYKVLENNNSIISVTQNSKSFKEMQNYLTIFKTEGFFNFKNTDIKGLYYFVNFIIKIMSQNLINSFQKISLYYPGNKQ